MVIDTDFTNEHGLILLRESCHRAIRVSSGLAVHRFSPQPQPPVGQHVVGHGIFQLGDVAHGDFLVALPAHDDGFVPHLRLRECP